MGEETSLYYYGVRYYNPRESVWLSTDPLSGYNPVMEFEHYIDGQHNGGVYNSFNHNTYGYCYQNPVLLVDPNGKQTVNEFTSGVKIDMTGAPAGSSTNAKGFARNGEWFWKEVYKSNPEMFSKNNVWKVQNGYSPVVDDTWISHNASHVGYKGGKLIHHHIDQGRFAVGIPEKVHLRFFKQLHNRSASWFKANKLKGATGMLRVFGGLLLVGDIYNIATGHPDAAFSSFDPKAPLNTLRGISLDPVQGNNYYEIESKNNSGTRFNVNFFDDFIDYNGTYRGIGVPTPGVIEKTDGGWLITTSHYQEL
ncbi:RHS repeat-associated core domain-containing protein [Apibacter sp. HY039]|uniref:RHS repeat-associated core domain-containing protein n=1 Tax=Apibacter sp. HY039 TaxID=2501476 RepID=UPI000FEBA149|nr:RHS repeat-associated core domain-containing protein [Apibacter sp. HY039]